MSERPKCFRPCLRETRETMPIFRDPDRSWCYLFTTNIIKLFWPQPMAPWTAGIILPVVLYGVNKNSEQTT